MITKTDAIILRISDYSNTSQIITCLTKKYGKVTLSAKGVHRYKTFNNGQYNLFCEVEILYYNKSSNNIHILKEITTLKTRSHIKTNWRAAVVASYFADIVAKISLPYHNQENIYELLDESLEQLNTNLYPSVKTIFIFEFKLLATLGLAPSLEKCSYCGKNLEDINTTNYFSVRNGGIICKNCYSNLKQHKNDIYIRKDVEKIMRLLQQNTNHNSIKLSKIQISEIERFMHNFIHHHIELYEFIKSRKIAIDLISRS